MNRFVFEDNKISSKLVSCFIIKQRTKINCDSDGFSKIKSWLEDHSAFKVGPQIIALESGLTDDNYLVTCDIAEEIGASIQKDLDGKTFSNVSFKRKT